MKQHSKIIVPALVALSVFAFAPVQAGDGKNGEIEVNKNAPETPIVGDGTESSKNEPQPPSDSKNDPQPPSDSKNDPQPPSDMPPADGKNDPQPPPPPPPPGGHGGGKNGGGGSGDNGTYGVGGVVTCVINGRVFKVRSVKQCYVQPSYGDYEIRPPVYHAHKQKHHRMMVSGGMGYVGGGYAYGGGYSYGGGYAYGGGYGYGGGYAYAPQPIIRYYKPASRAAIMQQKKRARLAAEAYGYGYAYGGGYGYQGGYAMQGGYGYEGGYAVTRKKHRRVRAQAPIYMPSYDQGYVVHYGPTISKDGGY